MDYAGDTTEAINLLLPNDLISQWLLKPRGGLAVKQQLIGLSVEFYQAL